MDMKISAYRQSIAEKPLQVGDIITPNSIKDMQNGKYILNINGKNMEALSKDILINPPLKLQVLKTNPLEVSLLKENSNLILNVGDKVNVKVLESLNNSFLVEINGKKYNASLLSTPQNSKFLAEVIKTEGLLLLKEINISPKISSLSLMAKEMMSFNQKEIAFIFKENKISHLTSFFMEDIKKFIRNQGQFFESKVRKGINISDDLKLLMYGENNSRAENAVTKLQIANVLMGSDFFTFFENEDLDFQEGVMRFSRNNNGGYSLYIKVNFTKIGNTIISFIKHYENSYFVTVRSKVNISAELSKLKIKNCKIVWKELKEKDLDFFVIKKDNLKEMNGFSRIG